MNCGEMPDHLLKNKLANMKKILINVPHLGRAGGVREIYKILDLDERKVADYFYLHDGTERESKLQVLLRMLKKYWQFWRLIQHYDLVLLNPSLVPRAFFRDAVFAWLVRARDKQLVIFWHGWRSTFEKKIYHFGFLRWLYRITFGKANAYVVLGKLFEKRLHELGAVQKAPILRFRNVADDQYLRELSDWQIADRLEHFKILFLSRIVREKGIYIVVDAYSQLRSKYPDKKLELIIAGNGNELTLAKKYVAQKNIPNVRFTGFVTAEAKHSLLKQASLFLFPTYHSEGLPLSILEAMLYGIPVLTRPVGGLTDIIKEGKNGFFIDSLDPAVFAEKMDLLLHDPQRYIKISNNNHKYAMEYLVPEKAQQELVQFLNSI